MLQACAIHSCLETVQKMEPYIIQSWWERVRVHLSSTDSAFGNRNAVTRVAYRRPMSNLGPARRASRAGIHAAPLSDLSVSEAEFGGIVFSSTDCSARRGAMDIASSYSHVASEDDEDTELDVRAYC